MMPQERLGRKGIPRPGIRCPASILTAGWEAGFPDEQDQALEELSVCVRVTGNPQTAPCAAQPSRMSPRSKGLGCSCPLQRWTMTRPSGWGWQHSHPACLHQHPITVPVPGVTLCCATKGPRTPGFPSVCSPSVPCSTGKRGHIRPQRPEGLTWLVGLCMLWGTEQHGSNMPAPLHATRHPS